MFTIDVPDGYEATGKWRIPEYGEWFITRLADDTRMSLGDVSVPMVILRKIPSPTVTVELPREAAEFLMTDLHGQGQAWWITIKAACHAALAAEGGD